MPDNVLLLQAPVGPFFRRFAHDLEQHGHTAFKINFNGGDSLFFSDRRSYAFRDKPDHWEAYLEDFISQHAIDRIYVFGDCRAYHRIAKQVAQRLGVRFFVFEEGYLRPNYITLEENGVNGHSDTHFVYSESLSPIRVIKEDALHFSYVFALTALYAVIYYCASSLLKWRFPHYQHHRPLNVFSEGSKWLLSLAKKLMYAKHDLRLATNLSWLQKDGYFLVPLQVHSDTQVLKHSRYKDVPEFITEVLNSFAAHADRNQFIVFKHHPLDRAYTDYRVLIKQVSEQLGIGSRVMYIFDCHLPELLRSAKGTVTINSTVGLSSLHHGTPVIALGKAIYNIDRLTFGGNLDEFWTAKTTVNPKSHKALKNYLLDSNQLAGSLYRRQPKSGKGSGLKWSPYLEKVHLGIHHHESVHEKSVAPQRAA